MLHSINEMTQPVTDRDRIHAIDMLRGIALFGVLVVNLVNEFRVSLFQQFLPVQPPSMPLDRAIGHFISMFLEMKAFALFSILFGVGLAIQFERLSRSASPMRLLVRRLCVLLAIGLIHLLFVWNGDILVEYALVGLAALPFLWMSASSMGLAASGLLAFYIVMPALPLPIFWPSSAWLQDHVLAANHVYATGTYTDIMHFSWGELACLLSLHEWAFPRTLGLFLVGMLAWRTGVLKDPRQHRHLLLAVFACGMIFGVLMGAPMALPTMTNWGLPSVARSCMANASGIFMGLGYGAGVIALVEFTRSGHVLRNFAPLGRMAFTNYLMQSVIFTWVFFGYGLGYFGQWSVSRALAFGIVVFACQMVLSKFWLRLYRFGPIEWLWRTLMYGVPQPMRRAR